jgi:hypothetical protein
MTAGSWAQEGGADVAAAMLQRYDPAQGGWDLEQTGRFWDTVGYARELGRLGEGHTIAVIDDGFDLSLPALAKHELAWAPAETESVAHGTVVALLIVEVAPAARLILYPVAVGGAWDPQRIERALEQVAETHATVVNLSLGQAFPEESVLAAEEFLREAQRWPNMSEEDIPFWIGERFGALDGWRALLRPLESSIGDAAARVVEAGHPVIAASGNQRGSIFSPAWEQTVFSVGFQRSKRAVVDGLTEEVEVGRPTFSQSDFYDFGVIQPPEVLGSSFATPLITGLAALMQSTADLSAFREVTRLAGIAAPLYTRLDHGINEDWSDRRDGVVDQLFAKAVGMLPHRHSSTNEHSACPECAFFALDAFVNFGLFKLGWGDLDGAELLLRSAAAFAPASPEAAANLGMVYAVRATRVQESCRWHEVSDLLKQAARLQAKASVLRPQHDPYRVRAAEFLAGAENPEQWKIAP